MDIREMSQVGLKYYETENDIKKRRKCFYSESGALIDDPYVANNKIASAYYKMLVDQKINYLLGNAPTLEIEENYFYKIINEVAIKASAQGVQWCYPYVKKGELRLKLIPTYELTPLYDENEELAKMYRHVIEDKEKYLYVYDKEFIYKYKGEKEVGTPISQEYHMRENVKKGSVTEVKGRSWGVVPFFKMSNNENEVYDLKPVKGLIDSYDIVLSDFANNLEDFQDVTWILKGYDGQDVTQFIDEVKKFKTLVVGEGGDAKSETIEIPYLARMEMLNKCEKLIFKFGFGVDMSDLSGGSLTNVAIKSQFANLDMKCNSFENYVIEWIDSYIEFYNIYAQMTGKQQIVLTKEVVFNKSNIMNEIELLKANVEQTGNISEKTKLANNPWVEDVEEERKQIEAEQAKQVVDLETPFS